MEFSEDVLLGVFAIIVLLSFLRSKSPRLDPSEVPRIIADAEVRMHAGKPQEAIELLELALRHHVGNPKLKAKLAQLRRESN